jgi:uncharacterized protein with WD repeat
MMRIFRDETSLRLTPELWPMIQRALGESEYFILMASPKAADSKWVENEVDEWVRLQNGSLEKFLIVLTEGEIAWDRSANDFDWDHTTALPLSLRNKFQAEPLHLDFRWARNSTHLSLRNPQFLRAIGKLAAALLNKPLDEIVGEDVRQHHMFKLVASAAIVLLFALSVVASGAAYYANERRKEAISAAEREKKAAKSERVARENEEKERQKAEQFAENERIAKESEEKQRKQAEKATENEREARQQAEERRVEAQRQQLIAEERRKETQRELVRINDANGVRAMDEGDLLGSLMWFTQALKLARGNASAERTRRIRIASILQNSPDLVQVWVLSQ